MSVVRYVVAVFLFMNTLHCGVVLAQSNMDFRAAYQKAHHALVRIEAKSSERKKEDAQAGESNDRIAVYQNNEKFFFTNPNSRESKFCGIMIDSKGIVLTTLFKNRPLDFTVTTVDGASHSAKLLVYDSATSCALLQIQGDSDFPAITKGQASELEPGLPVAMLWDQEPAHIKLATGVVTSETYWHNQLMLPISEASCGVQPGAAGGAVINLSGELCGVIFRTNFDSAYTSSYFVPLSILDPLLKSVDSREGTELQRGVLGVVLGQNAFVREVRKGSVAERIGISVGDFIKRINGKPVRDSFDSLVVLGYHRAGDQVNVEYQRGEDLKTVEVTLDSMPHQVNADSLYNVTPYGVYQAPWLSNESWPMFPNQMPKMLPLAPNSAGPIPSKAPPLPNDPLAETPGMPAPIFIQPPHIQVERSDLEESIRQLRKEINQLSEELKKQRK